MINQQLLDYINQRLISGTSKEEIKKVLLSNGWQENDIDDAINQASNLFTESIKTMRIGHALNRKVLILALVGILVVGSGVLGYFYYTKNIIVNQIPPVSFNPPSTEISVSTTTPADAAPTMVSSPASKSAPTSSKILPQSSTLSTSWVIVFTHRGTLLPNQVINFICDTVKSSAVSWIDRELTKNQITKPFSNIVCLSDQILLSEKQLSEGEEITGEAITFTNPINTGETIKFLENKTPSIIKDKYITVFHYLVPTELQFTNYQYSPKYDFEFITSYNLPDGKMVFHPSLTDIDGYSQELVHEFMHKMGATDKYFIGNQQACKIDPATGQQYSGYDIMCHRISIEGAEGFATPKFSELIISEATAREIKKQKVIEIYLETSSIEVISPNGGEIWKSSEIHRIKWSSRGTSSVRIYIYNSKAAGSGSTINIAPNSQPIPAVLGYYDWTIPSINQLPGGIWGNNYKIVIEDADYPGEKRDESDSLFSIIQ